MANRLARESSPYLRQHSENPVDWYPWGEEALDRAKKEDKPILLSIGYSACHWCHVMEHESFEDPKIAKLMNDHFISIKVDREERPDLDHIYQNVSQLMTRSGGWPLTVFLTPELKPFFGGTYFPPEDRYGRPGFPKVLEALSNAYKNDRLAIAENARRLTEAIAKIETSSAEGNKRPDAVGLRRIVDRLLQSVDWQNGGFGAAPKFPNTMNLTLLWRFGLATGFGMAKEAAIVALGRMASSGLYDQLGGGFHRYAVDQTWTVPHFEKMLYDNALLLKLYAEVLLTAQPDDLSQDDASLFLRVIEETTTYVLREMTADIGGFYSTQDADSEGEEGKFFVWDPASLRNALSADEAEIFAARHGVTDSGNFEDRGETVLFLDSSLEEIAAQKNMSAAQVDEMLRRARGKLFEHREKRVKPGRDEKIIASWNGLMISGLAWAAMALRSRSRDELADRARQSAVSAMDFIRAKMACGQNQERLHSVYKDGQARLNAYLDDYACLAMAALDLTRLTDRQAEIEELLAAARGWMDTALKHFKDIEGGFFFTSDDHEKLIQRPKTYYDQAMPSGNAIVIECLMALAEILGEALFAKEADEALFKLYPIAERASFGMAELATASLSWLQGPITVSGAQALATCIYPNAHQKPRASSQRPDELLICHRQACGTPLTETNAALKLIFDKLRL